MWGTAPHPRPNVSPWGTPNRIKGALLHCVRPRYNPVTCRRETAATLKEGQEEEIFL